VRNKIARKKQNCEKKVRNARNKQNCEKEKQNC